MLIKPHVLPESTFCEQAKHRFSSVIAILPKLADLSCQKTKMCRIIRCPREKLHKKESDDMFFKKSEPKRWSPTLGLIMGALTVVGAITVVNAAKSTINRVKSKMSSFCSLGHMSPSPCTCDEDDQY